ncbi:molybdopterin-dependent oxidoreductase [Paenibacillus sp. MBLB4367]|uniref:molybdopterin-dependent oxidoreductase n=1 Tax=Paenibacillus sp. MBLB4367 TaxID=3384767 RepID=UPI003908243C
MAGEYLEIGDRVPESEGRAFDFQAWYKAWKDAGKERIEEMPTHLKVEAADEFAATIPWAELGHAAFVYEVNGEPLSKGFPLRLYVPDGSSKCLNVKSVVRITLLHDNQTSGEATYGFMNQINPDDLRIKR